MNVLSGLDAMIQGHPAWNNPFFDRMKNGLSIGQLRKLCPEYLCFTQGFPGILSALVARADPRVQFYLVGILYSEMGSGVESNAHGNMFRRLCRDVGLREKDMPTSPRLESTRKLIDGLRFLYGESALLNGIGAQYALEFQADNMLRSLRYAFSYLDSGDKSNRSQGMEFFEVHLVEEPGHISSMRHAVIRNQADDSDFVEIFEGAKSCLDLFSQFWRGLDDDLV